MNLISVTGRHWVYPEVDEAMALAICQRHGLSELIGQVLAGRGLGIDDVRRFIEPRLRDWLPDPSHLLDMERVAPRLATAIIGGERIGIIGDYDVDGATATALLVRYLRAFGNAPMVLVPDRLGEGYGATAEAFDRLGAAGCRLCVTLDNGTTAFAALAAAAAAGQEVIVIDHHAAEAELPPAVGIINPNRLDGRSPLGHLAAVGVTFTVIVAVNRELRQRAPPLALPDPRAWLDLVALGTVCDVVSLTGLNRAFVRQGLKLAGMAAALGLRALAGRAGIETLGEVWQLGYALGPRLNAGSRLGHSELAYRLLATDDPTEAAELADRLDGLNRQRQVIERDLLQQALRAVEGQLATDEPVLVASGEGWHAGVIGIIASRLVDRYHRPAFVIAGDGGLGKGSARSVPGYDLGAIVIEARRRGLLVKGGGHPQAAGFCVETRCLGAFVDFARQAAGPAARTPATRGALRIDATLAVAGVTTALAQDLERVAPFGPGNDEPRFALQDARVVDSREVGEGHLRVILSGTGFGRLNAIAFRCRDTLLGQALASRGACWRIAGRVRLERWTGQPRAGFEIDDAAPA